MKDSWNLAFLEIDPQAAILFCCGISPLLARLTPEFSRAFVVRLTLIMYPLEVLWFEMLHWPLGSVNMKWPELLRHDLCSYRVGTSAHQVGISYG